MATVSPPTTSASNRVSLRDGREVSIRPMHASDAAADRQFLEGLSPETRRARFGCTVRDVDDRLLELLVHPSRGVRALVAVVPGGPGEPVDSIVGVSRYARADGGREAECAITVADAWQGAGLGTALFQSLCALARADGIERLRSIDSSSNSPMREFARSMGAHARTDPGDATQVIYDFELPPA